MKRLSTWHRFEIALEEVRSLAVLRLGHLEWMCALAIAAAAIILVDSPVFLRTLLGLPFLLFIPGYALVSALFPSREGLDGVERVALGLGLSLALIPLVALGIEYSPWSLTLAPIVIGLLATTIICCSVAIVRRRSVPLKRRYTVHFQPPRMPSPRDWDTTTRVAVGLIGVSITVLLITGSILVAIRMQGDHLTEFAIYNRDGNAEFYPQELLVGGTEPVVLEVTNLEGRRLHYHVVIRTSDAEITRIDGITLEDGEQWREPVEIGVPVAGDRIPVRFELYREDQEVPSEPYRTLVLHVTVVEQTSHGPGNETGLANRGALTSIFEAPKESVLTAPSTSRPRTARG